MFYDHNKTAEENEKKRKENMHNQQALNYIIAGITVLVVSITLVTKVREVMR